MPETAAPETGTAGEDDESGSMLAAYFRLKTRLAETDVCLTATWRMLDSSRIAVAQCKRTIALTRSSR